MRHLECKCDDASICFEKTSIKFFPQGQRSHEVLIQMYHMHMLNIVTKTGFEKIVLIKESLCVLRAIAFRSKLSSIKEGISEIKLSNIYFKDNRILNDGRKNKFF